MIIMKILSYIVFFAVWISACIFVDMVIPPDIANAYIMSIGYATGSICAFVYKYISS